MTMTDNATRPGLLRSVAFGDPTAEADAIYLFDKNCFLETDIYERCTRLESPLFVVGRRGSGKSATCMALSRRLPQESHVLVVEISPRGFHFAHAKELAQAMLSHTDINWEFSFYFHLGDDTACLVGTGIARLLSGSRHT